MPVTEERVNVTRRVVDRAVTDTDTAFTGDTIEVPVRGEEVQIQKSARVVEELEIAKDAVQETQRVTDTVRREEAHVQEANTTVVNDATTRSANVVDDVSTRTGDVVDDVTNVTRRDRGNQGR